MRKLVLAVLLLPVFALADDGIETQRPNFTNSPHTLKPKQLQIEGGAAYTKSQGVKTLDGPELLIRYGLKPMWEFQLFAPNYFSSTGAGTAKGFGDTQVGIEHQWNKTGSKVDLGSAIILSVPTGTSDYGSGGVDPSIDLRAQTSLNAKWSFGSMILAKRQTTPTCKNDLLQWSNAFGYNASDAFQPFIEVAVTAQKMGGTLAYVDTGFTYRIDNDHQWDALLNFKVDKNASATTFGVGYSVRFK